MQGAGDPQEEALAMRAEMRALCGCRVVVAMLFSLAIMISAVSCGTSFPGSYRASWQDTGRPKINFFRGKIEHDLFNGRYQNLEREAWEDD